MFEFPNQKKCLTNVFVYSTSISVNICMNNFSDLIHKCHSFNIENLSNLCELKYVTKSIYSKNFKTFLKMIEISNFLNIVCYDFWSSFTKAKSKQFSNFKNCMLDYCCLDSIVISILNLFLLNKLQWNFINDFKEISTKAWIRIDFKSTPLSIVHLLLKSVKSNNISIQFSWKWVSAYYFNSFHHSFNWI